VTSAAFEVWTTTGHSRKAHSEYTTDPIRWAVEKLGVRENTLRWSLNPGYAEHRWDGTIDPLVVIADAITNSEDVGVESGTGTGKSFFAAVLILWFEIDAYNVGMDGLGVGAGCVNQARDLGVWVMRAR
jgi:hypothetical protein